MIKPLHFPTRTKNRKQVIADFIILKTSKSFFSKRTFWDIAQSISVPDMSVLLQETDRNEILTTVRH